MKRQIADSRKLNDAGNSVTVSLPKRELETYGVLNGDGLAVDEASPYLDIERGVIGIEVPIPSE
ncbi:hypothetical protein GCM10027355_20130 [Haloplanus salinarum]